MVATYLCWDGRYECRVGRPTAQVFLSVYYSRNCTHVRFGMTLTSSADVLRRRTPPVSVWVEDFPSPATTLRPPTHTTRPKRYVVSKSPMEVYTVDVGSSN